MTVPETLEKYMLSGGAAPVPTRFRLRVLATKLSKRYTPAKPVSAERSGRSSGAGADADGDCDADGVNKVDVDDDNDLLDDTPEKGVPTRSTRARSTPTATASRRLRVPLGRDLNNDEYQDPNAFPALPGQDAVPEPA